LFGNRFDLRDKTVAASRHGHDKAMIARIFAENFPYCKNVLRQVGFLDKIAAPDCGHQFVFREKFARVANERQQRFENFRFERDIFSGAVEQPLRGQEAVVSEFVSQNPAAHNQIKMKSEKLLANTMARKIK